MKVGFLIINYNDYETTNKLINNIKNYNIIDKIVIVDNNSSDNSYSQLKKIENEKISVIKNSANKGYGSGINFGSKYLIDLYKECYIIVSNSDVIINSNEDLEKLIKTFDINTAVVGPIIKENNGLNRGWKVPTALCDSLLNIVYIHKYLRPKLIYYKSDYYNNEVIKVEAVSGCFFILDSNYLKEIDFFDENVFLYYEENILARKLQKINKLIKINTKVSVIHNHSVTIDKNINKIRKYKELKKSQFYFHKNYNKANIFDIMLLYITQKFSLLLLYITYFIKK